MSAWFLLNGAFKLIVGLVGLRAVRCCNEGNNSSEISYRRGAAVKLIILGIIYSFVSAHIYFESVTVGFTGYSVYAVASMTFWTLGNSIYGVVKYGKSRNPVLRSVKKTSIANALASVVLTQIVLLYEFGDGRDMSPANSLAAMAAGIAMIVMGLYDVLKE